VNLTDWKRLHRAVDNGTLKAIDNPDDDA